MEIQKNKIILFIYSKHPFYTQIKREKYTFLEATALNPNREALLGSSRTRPAIQNLDHSVVDRSRNTYGSIRRDGRRQAKREKDGKCDAQFYSR